MYDAARHENERFFCSYAGGFPLDLLYPQHFKRRCNVLKTTRYISTKEDYLLSKQTDDGRKWLLEEEDVDTGSCRYVEVVEERNPYARTGDGPAIERAKKARGFLYRKVSPLPKAYTCRLGYHRCVSQYTGEGEYPEFSGSSLNRKRYPSKKAKPRSEEVVHIFSDRSKTKVRDKATAFFRCLKRDDRIFLTLTFIEHVPDDQAVKILNKFLTVVRKERHGFQYHWVAEHQPENQAHTIHYHILLNRRLPIRRYNALWTLQQYNAGLQGKTADGRVIPIQEIRDRYEYDMTAKFRKKDPDSIQAVLNPAHIIKAYGINALAGYLTKYITKQKKEEFRCLNWHCSRKVSRLFTRQVVEFSTFSYLKSFSNYRVDYKTGECQPATMITRPFFSMIVVNNRKTVLERLKKMEVINAWLMDGFLPDTVPKLDNDLYLRIWCKPCKSQEKKLSCDDAQRNTHPRDESASCGLPFDGIAS
jgi:ribosomal protein S17E